MARKRHPGGRPPRTDDPQRMVILLPSSVKKRLLHQAIEEGRPASRVIEDALLRYLARQRRQDS